MFHFYYLNGNEREGAQVSQGWGIEAGSSWYSQGLGVDEFTDFSRYQVLRYEGWYEIICAFDNGVYLRANGKKRDSLS